ncbi:hypothetical protein CENSYa_0014 [Cenarchaeum symbiosum A]|uniref:Uncharacterized protein n=1 Tax=Cenarchaeum symbiosum (strain A) TaxID=414004 RepID=A0RTK5_CENSY|nr:hypothetical protein CENSYa_0014 [Cenarchaeum symbiosum A]
MLTIFLSAGSFEAHAQHGESIPSWVRTIFNSYAEDHITDEEMLNIIGYLVQIGVIPISQSIIDPGNLYVTYYDNPNPRYDGVSGEVLRSSMILEREVDYINENFRLPHDIQIITEECGKKTTYYNNREIVICYEFINDLFYTNFISNEDKYKRDHDSMLKFAATQATSMLTYVIYHELAHALIDMYELPIKNQESAADQFASLVLLHRYGNSGTM